MTLWLNSALGISSILAARVDTKGAWIEMKKPILKGLVVLDPRALKPAQRQQLVRAYDTFSANIFKSIPEIAADKTRGEIDAVIMKAPGVNDDLGILRRMVAEESGYRKPVGKFPFGTRDMAISEEAYGGFSPEFWNKRHNSREFLVALKSLRIR